MIIEKIQITGIVKSVSDPFKSDYVNYHLITIDTGKGLMSLPVKDPGIYAINQNVEIYVEIKNRE